MMCVEKDLCWRILRLNKHSDRAKFHALGQFSSFEPQNLSHVSNNREKHSSCSAMSLAYLWAFLAANVGMRLCWSKIMRRPVASIFTLCHHSSLSSFTREWKPNLEWVVNDELFWSKKTPIHYFTSQLVAWQKKKATWLYCHEEKSVLNFIPDYSLRQSH